jgi:hypothetical protein
MNSGYEVVFARVQDNAGIDVIVHTGVTSTFFHHWK